MTAGYCSCAYDGGVRQHHTRRRVADYLADAGGAVAWAVAERVIADRWVPGAGVI
jgi:hypothetical protein